MEAIESAIRAFFEWKPYVMLPFIVFALGLLAGMGLKGAGLASLRLGAGFAGVFLVFEAFVAAIGPAVAALVANTGLSFPVADVGWPPLAAITWSSFLAPLSILLVLGLNFTMLALKLTKTLYIDIWNYWHFAFIGALFQATGASLPLSIAAILAIAAYSIKTTEWSAPFVERATGIKGLAVSPLSVSGLLPWGVAADRLIERIPGLRRVEWNPSRHGGAKKPFLAEPMAVGVLLGLFLGVLADYEIKKALELAALFAAVMFLLPKAGGLIGEGMGALSEAIRAKVAKRFPGRADLSIAVDTGFLMTNASVVTTGLVLMPLALGLAFVLPGARLIPMGDLPNLMSIMSCVTIACGGNVFRAVLAGLPIVASFILIAGELAPLFTRLSSGLFDAGGAAELTAFTDGGNQIRYLFMALKAGDILAIASLPVIGFLMWLAWRRQKAVAAELEGRQA
jgi:PTS system galactitol-specific IIC component